MKMHLQGVFLLHGSQRAGLTLTGLLADHCYHYSADEQMNYGI